MNDTLPYYHGYTCDRLVAMGKVYYRSNPAPTPFQAGKYEHVRACLLAELRSLYPDAKDKGSAAYIHAAIAQVLHRRQLDERSNMDRLIANGHTAHEQLKNWK